jgi:predicted Zn-dependent protease
VDFVVGPCLFRWGNGTLSLYYPAGHTLTGHVAAYKKRGGRWQWWLIPVTHVGTKIYKLPKATAQGHARTEGEAREAIEREIRRLIDIEAANKVEAEWVALRSNRAMQSSAELADQKDQSAGTGGY